MAKAKRVNYEAFPSITYVFVFFATLDFVFSQSCILDIKDANESNCELGTWGGFIDENCCGGAFEEYLYALGRQANVTQTIYLNATEQHNCLTTMEVFEKDVLGCGIQRLTSGAGGCSDYTVKDVVEKLGFVFKNFQEDCKELGTGVGLDGYCSTCLRRWEEIGGSLDYKHESGDVCRFAALVSMISYRIDHVNWVFAVFQCLGDQAYSLGKGTS